MISRLEDVINVHTTRLDNVRMMRMTKALFAIRIRDRVNFYTRGERENLHHYVNNGVIFSSRTSDRDNTVNRNPRDYMSMYIFNFHLLYN